MNWNDLAEDRDQWKALANTLMSLPVPQNVGKFLSSCTTGSFSRRPSCLLCILLGNNRETNRFPHTTIKELLGMVFSEWSMSRY
jgi:hypothetical protein